MQTRIESLRERMKLNQVTERSGVTLDTMESLTLECVRIKQDHTSYRDRWFVDKVERGLSTIPTTSNLFSSYQKEDCLKFMRDYRKGNE